MTWIHCFQLDKIIFNCIADNNHLASGRTFIKHYLIETITVSKKTFYQCGEYCISHDTSHFSKGYERSTKRQFNISNYALHFTWSTVTTG